MVNERWCSTTFSSCISEILEQHVSETTDRTKLTNSMPSSFPWLNSLDFYLSLSIWGLLFALKKSVPSRTSHNKEKCGLQKIGTIPGIFQQFTRSLLPCHDDRSRHWAFAWSSGGRNSETFSQKTYNIISSYWDADSPAAGLTAHFLFVLYRHHTLRKVHLGFGVGKVAVGQVFEQPLQFPLSVSFHQCFIWIFHSAT